MQVTAIEKTSRTVQVEVDQVKLLLTLFTNWKKSQVPELRHHDQITIEGQLWLGWSDGHGSGHTEKGRQATTEEITMYSAYSLVLDEVSNAKK